MAFLAFSLLKEKIFRVTAITAAHWRSPKSSLLKTSGEILSLCLSPSVCNVVGVHLVNVTRPNSVKHHFHRKASVCP